jgi:UDP-glucuronate decarboxylase
VTSARPGPAIRDAAQALIDRDVDEIIERLGSVIDDLSGATVLVTGASGMFGGYLADLAARLNTTGRLSEPLNLYLATRTAPQLGHRLGHLIDRHDVRFVIGDSPDARSFPDRADVIIHAASPASPQKYFADPVGTLDANSRYLRGLLELAATGKASAFLYISSSEIYGNPPNDAIPTPESFVGAVDPLSPRACYVEGKRFGETLAMAYHRQYGVPVSIIRPFHVHGPGLRLDDGRIVAELIRAGLRGERFTLSSDGSATRCYGYVADATAGAYAALLRGAGEAFNIGVDSPETTILELASIVADLAGTEPPRPSAGPLPAHLAGAPARSRPDLSRARTILGYEPAVGLRDGLSRTIAWHRARETAEVSR